MYYILIKKRNLNKNICLNVGFIPNFNTKKTLKNFKMCFWKIISFYWALTVTYLGLELVYFKQSD